MPDDLPATELVPTTPDWGDTGTPAADLPPARPVPPALLHRQTIANAVGWSYCQPYLIADNVMRALHDDGFVIVTRDDLNAVLDDGLTTGRDTAAARLRTALGRRNDEGPAR